MEKHHAVILGAGFAGLELATRLSESLADEIRVTLIDKSEAFHFGYSKLDVLFGRKTTAEVLIPYEAFAKPGVDFRRESITSIDPGTRHVTTDRGAYDADILVVALGADYDYAATPGFVEGGLEYYSLAGAEQMRDALPAFESGTILVGILGHPFKCPPAPFEGALLLHDYLERRGIRDAAEIRVVGPMSAPVPITKEVSRSVLDLLDARDIDYVGDAQITKLDPASKRVHLANGEILPYDLFVGIPVHRVPEVVASSGLARDGWIPVDRANLRTEFPNVYALGDVAAAGTAKAGGMAEAAAVVVAADIAATLHGEPAPPPWEGAGTCFIEFGGGTVGKVEANFLGGPAPTARLVGPSLEFAAEKDEFGRTRRARWFGLEE